MEIPVKVVIYGGSKREKTFEKKMRDVQVSRERENKKETRCKIVFIKVRHLVTSLS